MRDWQVDPVEAAGRVASVAGTPGADLAPTPVHALASEILALSSAGDDCFVAEPGARNHSGGVFGGRFIAQALHAAIRTVDHLPPSSLHGYFLAAGKVDLPLTYRVQRLRDSRRFANRQVMAEQDGRVIFALMCEFHEEEAGFEHQASAMPDVPPPQDVAALQDFVQRHGDALDPAALRNFSGPLPVELRPIAPERYFLQSGGAPVRELWFRVPGAGEIADPRLHACLAAFASDYWLAGTAAVPHAFPTNNAGLLISSLDHAMWFHRPLRCDEWLLHRTTSPSASNGLGLGLGEIFDTRGRLVASTAQECLMRRRSPGQ